MATLWNGNNFFSHPSNSLRPRKIESSSETRQANELVVTWKCQQVTRKRVHLHNGQAHDRRKLAPGRRMTLWFETDGPDFLAAINSTLFYPPREEARPHASARTHLALCLFAKESHTWPHACSCHRARRHYNSICPPPVTIQLLASINSMRDAMELPSGSSAYSPARSTRNQIHTPTRSRPRYESCS